MTRRDFISRFFKGLAVAAIAPQVIAKACEDAQIPKGTVFSFAPEQLGAMEWKLPPHFEWHFDKVWIDLMANQADLRAGGWTVFIPGKSEALEWMA